ncbi:MAG TPA: 30S ribosomal protein S7 [Chloroflexi bacterium]|nr:30S ribosomal protein S7 [Chloroflexota bacterium]
MSRRKRPEKRVIPPDPRFNNRTVQRFINKVMNSGKKSVAQSIVYGAFDIVEARSGTPAIDTFENAVRNVMPQVEVKPRRVGGANYQVPVEIRGDRRYSLAVRWIIDSSRNRSGRSMRERLAAELLEAADGQGGAVRRRDEVHRMAEANRAFAIYAY